MRIASFRRPGRVLAGIVSTLLMAGALASCTSTVGYAALVNGSAISQTKINQELADISANKQYVQLINQPGGSGPVAGSSPGTYNKGFVAALLDQQVRFEVIHQTLVAKKTLPTPDQVTKAKTAVSQAFPSGVYAAFPARYQNLLANQQADADQFVTAVTGDLTGDALTQYYQAHQNDYSTEACVRHILIADKDPSGQLDYGTSLVDAAKVKALLNAGGDFAALAKQYSQDNQGTTGGSANQGGLLAGSAADGCLTTQDLSQLITEFAQVVVSLPLNTVSNPVRTQFGYHLIEVTKRVNEPLDAKVTTDIQRRVAGQRLNSMVAKAKVKVNPEFGSFDSKTSASGQVTGVVPPIVPSLTPTTSTTVAAAGGGGAAGSSSGSTAGSSSGG